MGINAPHRIKNNQKQLLAMAAKEYDVIVIGSGSGLTISSYAASKGLKVAVIEDGPFGGTCLNRGCITSKMLIHAADVSEAVQRAHEWGIKSGGLKGLDWKKLQRWVWGFVNEDSKGIERGNRNAKNIDVYKGRARFTAEKTLEVNGKTLRGEKIFICAGARPAIPHINGLEGSGYITSTEALALSKQPKSMVIIGGGYISAELGHFYSSIGTKVTLLSRGGRLVKNEDGEISELFTKITARKYDVMFMSDVQEVKGGRLKTVKFLHNGKRKTVKAEQLLIATGVEPNTDDLHLHNANVQMDEKCFVKVNEFMETSAEGVWAIGDVAGKHLFKHSANLEAAVCARNALDGQKIAVDYTAMPHAVFSSPQIAGAGFTEQELKKSGKKYLKGKYYYYKTAMGKAMEEKEGFAKALVEPETGKILGFHIIGPEASTLIHEVLVAMKNGLTANDVLKTVHIHPALSEVVQRAFRNLK